MLPPCDVILAQILHWTLPASSLCVLALIKLSRSDGGGWKPKNGHSQDRQIYSIKPLHDIYKPQSVFSKTRKNCFVRRENAYLWQHHVLGFLLQLRSRHIGHSRRILLHIACRLQIVGVAGSGSGWGLDSLLGRGRVQS